MYTELTEHLFTILCDSPPRLCEDCGLFDDVLTFLNGLSG